MRLQGSLKKRTALLLVTVVFGVLTTACLPASSTTGTQADATSGGVIAAMNRDRAANGLPPLSWNSQLADSGAGWAAHLAATNSSLVHQDLGAVINTPAYAGYATLGENLLVGPGAMTADQMERAWMGSPGHRANILGASFRWAGVGYAYGPDGRIWVAVEFGG